jgi:lysyl-tRNA synthetase class 2
MPRVFEVARNFRNEGISVRHNPEFTMIELYQAFGDYNSMMALIERLMHTLATEICGADKLPFGDLTIDYTLPFPRVKYHEVFEKVNGFASSDHEKLVAKAQAMHIKTHAPDGTPRDHDLILSEVWEETVEPSLDKSRPTFVIDYPAAICPLTKIKPDNPQIAERFELYVAGMEVANAYTELNDPDIQEANFRQQLAGQKEDESMAKMDMDFVEALRVGMPPAGGLGFGVDRLVMLLTNSRSIRDVILFPLMRPEAAQQ